MALKIAPSIRSKLASRHQVKESDVIECFANRDRGFLIDKREEHQTNPPSKWFIAETDYGKKLKVVFIELDGDIHIKTAYAANEEEIRIYKKYAPAL